MKICSITPNRGGERENLLKFCCEQLRIMGMQNSYIMNDPPKSDKCDLVWRIRNGIELAKKDGMEWVFIIESDDYYPSDYINKFLPYMGVADFIGDPYSYYYRIDNQTWQRFHHHGRASLFTTAFRVSALEKFNWPPDDKVFLDIDLWRYAKNAKLKMKFIDSGALGIKGHGFGKSGGKGHRMKLKNEDVMLRFFKSKVDEQHLDFYYKLMHKI